MELVIRDAVLALVSYCFCLAGLWMSRCPAKAYKLFAFEQTTNGGFGIGFFRIIGRVFAVIFGFGAIALCGSSAHALFQKLTS